MTAINPSRVSGLLSALIAFHIVVIAASNYLVQIPVTLAGFPLNLGHVYLPH